MTHSFLDEIDSAALPLPQDRPFTTAEAVQLLGGSRHALHLLRSRGIVLTPLRGVHHLASVEDSLAVRLACVRLVAPPDAVVCDRTAGWLLGAPRILAPGDHLVVPSPSLFLPDVGRRMRRQEVTSGSRSFGRGDVIELGGVMVTSPMRTACDLGRLLHRDQAFAALDSLLRTAAFTRWELMAEVGRFRGMRGVRQLRDLAPLADGASQSPGESILRLRWLDCADLPRPQLQVPVPGPWGCYYVDLGLPELRFGGEYDGAEWHGPERAAHDAARRTQMGEHAGWSFEVFRGDNVHGRRQDADVRLRRALLPMLAARPRILV